MNIRNCLSWVVACGIVLFSNAVFAKAPVCPKGGCGIGKPVLYPNIVIGPLQHVASDTEMRKFYRWAKAGPWKKFPDSEDDYVARNRLFVVPVDKQGTPVILHMCRQEYDQVDFHTGDLIRYTTHIGPNPHQSGPAPMKFSTIAGCIMIVCRAEDKACWGHYQQGVFRRADGVQIDFKTGKPIPDGIVIDTVSMLPKPKEAGPAKN